MRWHAESLTGCSPVRTSPVLLSKTMYNFFFEISRTLKLWSVSSSLQLSGLSSYQP